MDVRGTKSASKWRRFVLNESSSSAISCEICCETGIYKREKLEEPPVADVCSKPNVINAVGFSGL
jgi:hypothetical protein